MSRRLNNRIQLHPLWQHRRFFRVETNIMRILFRLPTYYYYYCLDEKQKNGLEK